MGRWRQGRAIVVRSIVLAVVAAVLVAVAAGLTTVPSVSVRPPAAAGSTAVAASPVAAAPIVATAPAGPRPNVVLFLVDDMRADDLAWMPATRRLLAQRGMSFTEAVSPHPLCCPARAGLLTGQYAQNNGVQHNKGSRGGYGAFDPRSTVATWLRGGGYRTGFVGKHLNAYEGTAARDPGWDYFKPLVAHTYEYVRFRFRGEAARRGYVTDAIQARTRTALTRFAPGSAPFFVVANHLAPHGTNIGGVSGPPRPEPAHRDAYAGARPPSMSDPAYNEADMSDKPASQRSRPLVPDAKVRQHFLARIRSLASVDDAVEDTVRVLRRLGELDRTYIVFTSDNGYALGEHRLMSKNVLADEVLRVPLLVRGPGVPAGSHDRRTATLLDLAATIVDLTRVRAGLPLDGRSFAPAWRAGAGGSAWRDTTLVQTGRPATGGRLSTGWGSRGVLTDRYLFGHEPGVLGSAFLYDRRVDPHELVNVAADARYAQVAAALMARTLELGECAGAACHRTFGPLPEPAPPASLE